MKTRFVLSFALFAAPFVALMPVNLTAQSGYPPNPVVDQSSFQYDPYSADQLDNLLAPVALYPDALLAQVLVAATFPDQIDEAARFVRANGTSQIDDQDWDSSVKAVAHYPTVLNMMSDRLDWTTSLGQAYAGQSTDVMVSVQRLRAMANSQGNLVSTPQQQVIVDGGYIEIVPAEAQVIYVPTYDPSVIYFRSVYSRGGFGSFWSFGIGFPIGAWLSYDVDWRQRRVFYDGWRGGGWRARSRPFVHFTPSYVNARFETVNINRGVERRRVNVGALSGFNTVHRTTTFENRDNRPVNGRGATTNTIIDRNVNPRDPQVNNHRGREAAPARPMPPTVAPPTQAPPPQAPPMARPIPPPSVRPGVPPGRPIEPPAVRQAQPPTVHPTPAPPTVVPTPPPHPFGRSEGNFDPRTASQRGQESRARGASPTPPTARPTPPPPTPKPTPPPKPDDRGRQSKDAKKRPA